MLPTRDTSNLFALEVKGDSMIDAMVNDGDYVILRPADDSSEWRDGRDLAAGRERNHP